MRIIFRLVEFGQGVSSSNPILTHEGYTFGLDALPMLLAAVLLNIVHPGLVLKGPDSEFPRLSRGEKKALKREKKEEKEGKKKDRKLAKQSRKEQKRNTQNGELSGDVLPMAQNAAERRFGADGAPGHHDVERGYASVRDI